MNAFVALRLLIHLKGDVKGFLHFLSFLHFTPDFGSQLLVQRHYSMSTLHPCGHLGCLFGTKPARVTWVEYFSWSCFSVCFIHPGVRRMWMNVPQTRVWTGASVSTTWTDLSVCAIWITRGYTAKWMSATSTCMSSWACGRTSFSWCPTLWYASTMSQKLSGDSRLTTRPLLVHFGQTGLNLDSR